MSKGSQNGLKSFPQIIGAFFCERTLDEKDNVLSAIRIVDVVSLPPVPEKLKRGAAILLPNLVFLLMVRAGKFRGKALLEVQVVGPTGKRDKAGHQEIELLGEPNTGTNIRLPASIKWDNPGVYWYEIYANKRLVARSPLQIRIMPAPPKAQESKKPPKI